MKTYCNIAVNYPSLNSTLTYLENPEIGCASVGQFVKVPLGNRFEKGVVLKTNIPENALHLSPTKIKYKKITEIIEQEIILHKKDIELFIWVSKYYHYGLGKLIFDCLPKFAKSKKQIKFIKGAGLELPFKLNQEQLQILNNINSLSLNNFLRFYIHGITGSGKTAIYINLINQCIKENKSVLFLLPEINLTPQFIGQFESYIDSLIFSYHSGITKTDKFLLWKTLESDSLPKLIVGARSSVFLPIKNLGLIIVDEEHDNSYKQEDRCPYLARDVALKKAMIFNIPILLGSATPSLESYYHYFLKKHRETHSFILRERIGDSVLPNITLVTTKDDKDNASIWPLTVQTISKIESSLKKNEQILVLINQLGFARFLQCRSCGYQFQCPNCSTKLRYFQSKNHLACQFCDYTAPISEYCPKCNCLNIMQRGFGTEKVHKILSTLFPEHLIDRFDRDAIKTTKQLKDILKKFHSEQIDILVGTQMLSKGHNFKKVNLVVVLGIDGQLNFPDFRSNEKIYQLLTQVSGRSGRFGGKSEVLIQTLSEDSNILQLVKNHSFDEFYKEEIPIREMCNFPPFTKMAMLYLTSKNRQNVIDISNNIKKIIDQLISKHFKDINALGPKAAMFEKRVNKYTWCIMLRSKEINQLHNLIDTILENYEFPSTIKFKIDIDPYTYL